MADPTDGARCFMVGGVVRDEMLGVPGQDRDWVVVGATPQQMIEQGYRRVGRDFPVFLHPATNEEYALARTERKTAPGYHGFEVDASPSVTLEEDLLRRDLTINAMAKDASGQLIDPYNGLADIKNRKLRHVSPAFAEDPVRILRVARFAARYAEYGFNVAAETQTLMSEMVANGEIDTLVPERVWMETKKALAEPAPDRFIAVLRDCGALARVFPEIDALFGIPQPVEHHPEIDTGEHVQLCLRRAVVLGANSQTRYAVLVHDLGKASTPEAQWPKHVGHEKAGVALCARLADRLRVPNDYRSLGALVCEYHLTCHQALALRPGKLLNLLQALDPFRKPERFEDFLLACQADAQGRLGFESRPYQQASYLRAAFRAVAGIGVESFLAKGLKGAEIAAALRHERLAVLSQFKAKYAKPTIESEY